MTTPLFDDLVAERQALLDGPTMPIPTTTKEPPVGRHHDDDRDGRADGHACSGENRADPDSWDEPAIAGPTAPPATIAPADLDENGEVPPCS